MHVFEMIAIIVVVTMVAGVFKEYLAAKKIQPVDLTSVEGRLDKLEMLQKRIETLEAIVTDNGYDLRQQINNLK